MEYVNYVPEKICKKCSNLKSIDSYDVVKDHKGDLVYRNTCKRCISEQNRKRRDKKSEEIKKYQQTQEYKNKKKVWDKTYNETHSTKIKKKKSEYYQLNKAEIAIKNLEYNKNNRHIRNNREKKNENPKYKLKSLVSSRISAALKSFGTSKNKNTFTKYVPYSMGELQQYLESLFEPWMNWENWGKYNSKTWNDNDFSTWTWQVDHIIPRAELLYSSMEGENFKKCWALNNLRPLSAKQNIINGARITRRY